MGKKIDWMERGVFCISIDLELAWGFAHAPTLNIIDLASRLERVIVRQLLQLFEEYEISATWAIVGRILKKGDHPMPDSSDQAWYAPDIVEMVRNGHPVQEIGSHGFSHIYYSKVKAEDAESDIAEARKVHQKNGLEFISFSYPRDMISYVDLLSLYGVRVFRSGSGAERLAQLGRFGRFVDKFLPIPPKTVLPVIHSNGLIELPASMLLMGRDGIRRLVNPEIYLIKVREALRDAVREKSLFHLWFHPSNFYFQPETQFKILGDILAYASGLRARKEINIWPMKSFVGLLERNKGA